MYCNYCGKVIQDDANICAYCGVRVGGVIARKRLVRPRAGAGHRRRLRWRRRILRHRCHRGAPGVVAGRNHDRDRPALLSDCLDSDPRGTLDAHRSGRVSGNGAVAELPLTPIR